MNLHFHGALHQDGVPSRSRSLLHLRVVPCLAPRPSLLGRPDPRPSRSWVFDISDAGSSGSGTSGLSDGSRPGGKLGCRYYQTVCVVFFCSFSFFFLFGYGCAVGLGGTYGEVRDSCVVVLCEGVVRGVYEVELVGRVVVGRRG